MRSSLYPTSLRSRVSNLNQPNLRLIIYSFNRRKTLPLNIFGYGAGFEELQQIIRATSFRTNSRKFESSEGLARYHSASNSAIDVQVSDFKIGWGSIDMRRRARIQLAG